MSRKNKPSGFIIYTIDKLNNLVTELYESLMDNDIEEAEKVITETEEIIIDLKETIKKDGV